jgi:hypothetical protein
MLRIAQRDFTLVRDLLKRRPLGCARFASRRIATFCSSENFLLIAYVG